MSSCSCQQQRRNVFASDNDHDFKSQNDIVVVKLVDSYYQNPVNRYDVDDNSDLNPFDVLALINAFRRHGVLKLVTQESVGLAFVDVDANRMLEPIDILQVINALNRIPASGEGAISTATLNSSNTLAATTNAFAVDFTNSLESSLPSQRKRSAFFLT